MQVDAGEESITYSYNGDGQRVSKTVNGEKTEYIYNGDILAGQKTGNTVLVFMYDNNGDPFGFVYSGTEYYYVKNVQNDVTAIASADGTIIANYYYDPWGRLIEITGDSAIAELNPIRYRSYYYDSETELYYLNTRYYSPDLCRFMNSDRYVSGVDGSIDGFNLYVYCINNPINLCDLSGNWPQWVKNAADWVNNNIIKPIVKFFNPNTNTISGSFEDKIFKGSGSITGGYSEKNVRLQANTSKSNNNGMLGVYGKISVGNANGKIGVGNDVVALSLKGVGDVLSATAQAGIQYSNGVGVAARGKAAVLTGRATMELELLGWEIEFGVSGDLLSVGAEVVIGVFPDDGFTAKASAGVGLYGVGLVFRIKPEQ